MFTRLPTAAGKTAETSSMQKDGWEERQKEREKNVRIRQSSRSSRSRRRNSPRRNLLPLEILRASSWPMELRKIITSATSPSCIVLADLPRPCRRQTPATGRNRYVWEGPYLSRAGEHTSAAIKDDPNPVCSFGFFFPRCWALRHVSSSSSLLLLACFYSFTPAASVSEALWSEGWWLWSRAVQASRRHKEASRRWEFYQRGVAGAGLERREGLCGEGGGREGGSGGGGVNGKRSKFWWFNPWSSERVGWQSMELTVWSGLIISESLCRGACVLLEKACRRH